MTDLTPPSGAIHPTSRPTSIPAQVVAGIHHQPHHYLGQHQDAHEVTFRILCPDAQAVSVLRADGTMVRLRPLQQGIWTATAMVMSDPDYRVVVRRKDGTDFTYDDPYRQAPDLGELDLHLIGEGRHEALWEVLGAHLANYVTTLGEVTGCWFTVWAPHASAVQVRGDFNEWSPQGVSLSCLADSGIWRVFVPGANVGDCYKFRIRHRSGHWVEKADPMARWTEAPPRTASRIHTSSFAWTDAQWLTDRVEHAHTARPMSTYEIHLGSWRPGLNYQELAAQLTEYVLEMGFTHVELLPIAEHPYGGSWGYQVTSYYAPTARFGTPDEFRYLVDRLHAAGIGVLLDWVPAHFPKDDWALAQFDGEPLYEAADPKRGEHPDWGTLVFDYGRNEVRNFLVANALYWLQEFHLDGLRVDAVASMLYLDYSRPDGAWIPNQYGGRENLDAIALFQEVNTVCTHKVPGVVLIAEESTSWEGVTKAVSEGGLGFAFKWNMGWMHDTLNYLSKDPVHRQYHHNDLTFGLVYAWSENFVLPISHDEVVHGKGTLTTRVSGDRDTQWATARAYLAFMWAHPGKKLLFMGQEFGQVTEWSEAAGLPWDCLHEPGPAGVQHLVRDLNNHYRAHPALWAQDHLPVGFQWLVSDDAASNTVAFVRHGAAGEQLVCVVNFSGAAQHDYVLPLPLWGGWREILNTDASEYQGSGLGNAGYIHADHDPSDSGFAAHAKIVVPALSALWFVPA